MKNKSIIIFLTLLVSSLCVYYLSFSYFSRRVEKEAKEYALTKPSSAYEYYLDSVWDQPAVTLLGQSLTYQDLVEKQLGLGLDLQGGLHVILAVSPGEILAGLCNNPKELHFKKALQKAELQNPGVDQYLSIFAEELRRTSEKPLAYYFSSRENNSMISMESSDQEVIEYLENEVSDAVDRTFDILRRRIDQFGVANPNIQRLSGTNRIQIELAGVDNPERVKRLLQGMANLEFWEVYDINETKAVLLVLDEQWQKMANPNQPSSLVSGQEVQIDSLMNILPAPIVRSPVVDLLQPGYGLQYRLEDTSRVNDFLKMDQIANRIPLNLAFKWAVKSEIGAQGETLQLFALKAGKGSGAILKGDIISDASQAFDDGPTVSMSMNAEGTRHWSRITEQNIGRQIAIVMDGHVYSAPLVNEKIPNGQSVISGNFTLEEAKDLSNVLKTGKLPGSVVIVEEAVIGPSLGQTAISQGLLSLVAGVSLIALFMMLYYGRGGAVANLAVMVNMVWIVGILAQFGATLTLPGIAGLVLTVGMAVDANVLIFERIKEEIGKGLDLKASIKLGYDKAYSSILDSNITTFLTGLILYTFGTGSVRGFAIVLLIGVVCSVFTAVFITRLILEFMARRNMLRPSSFDTVFSRSMRFRTNFDFIRVRKKAYFFSMVVIFIGLVSVVFRGGYPLGIDFSGGRSFIVQFDGPVSPELVKQELAPYLVAGSLEVVTYDDDRTLKITTGYLLDSHGDHAENEVRTALSTGLSDFEDLRPQIVGSTMVGPSIADDFQSSAVKTVLFSLLIIFLYILVRFRKWQYGLGALVALIHDVAMIFSIFALLGWIGIYLALDQIFIAAVLTIIGYSINDTVVVFDRIREFSGKVTSKKATREALNPAINNTLSRTLITSFTVLIVVVILLIFGGDVLKGFSIALLVGVIFGTYSSIFIASSLALDFQRQDPEKPIERSLKPRKKQAA